MHQNGRVFGKHLDNQVEKKHGKNKKDLDEMGGKENIINDAIITKDGFNAYESPQSVSLYQQEIYEFLNEREINNKDSKYSIDQTKINESVRATTIRFIIKLTKTFTLKLETLFQTVDLMDQTIQHLNPVTDDLELISLSCLFIATKYEEIYPPPLPILIQGTGLTAREVINMEKEILQILNFNIISDNTLIWLQLLGELMGCNINNYVQIKQRCLQLAEISLMSSLFLSFKKSTIALCIYSAVELMMGNQKTQFKWEKLSEHSKPGRDSKPLKLLTYMMRLK